MRKRSSNRSKMGTKMSVLRAILAKILRSMGLGTRFDVDFSVGFSGEKWVKLMSNM